MVVHSFLLSDDSRGDAHETGFILMGGKRSTKYTKLDERIKINCVKVPRN